MYNNYLAMYTKKVYNNTRPLWNDSRGIEIQERRSKRLDWASGPRLAAGKRRFFEYFRKSAWLSGTYFKGVS